MSTATATASYRKTKQGEWVVMALVADLRECVSEGMSIEVVKRDGTRKGEVIDRVGKPFAVNGVQMAYGYILQAPRNARPTRSHAHSGNRCMECGQYLDTAADRRDGIHFDCGM